MTNGRSKESRLYTFTTEIGDKYESVGLEGGHPALAAYTTCARTCVAREHSKPMNAKT